jgi:hypothetical protein
MLSKWWVRDFLRVCVSFLLESSVSPRREWWANLRIIAVFEAEPSASTVIRLPLRREKEKASKNTCAAVKIDRQTKSSKERTCRVRCMLISQRTTLENTIAR